MYVILICLHLLTVHEELTVVDASITSKSVLVLEPGKAPEENQVNPLKSS